MAKKVRTINDQIADAVKGQAAAKAAKRAAAKPAAVKAEKAPAKAKATRKPGNLRTTGLPNKVRTHRMKAGLSPKDLADKVGQNTTASHIRRIERGARQATTGQQAAIAEALNVSVQALGFKAAPAKAPAAKAKGIQAPDLQPGESVSVDMETGQAVSAAPTVTA